MHFQMVSMLQPSLRTTAQPVFRAAAKAAPIRHDDTCAWSHDHEEKQRWGWNPFKWVSRILKSIPWYFKQLWQGLKRDWKGEPPCRHPVHGKQPELPSRKMAVEYEVHTHDHGAHAHDKHDHGHAHAPQISDNDKHSNHSHAGHDHGQDHHSHPHPHHAAVHHHSGSCNHSH